MYSRLRSSTIRSKSASKSPKNKSYRVRDASMHSRSSSMEVNQIWTLTNLQKIKSIMLQSTEESQRNQMIHKKNLSSISLPQSQLSDQSSPEYSPLRPEKSLESEKEYSSSDEVSPRLLQKEISQKLLEFYRAGLSELDVIHKNITGLNKRTVYCHFKKLKQTGTSLRKSGSGRRCKLTYA